MSLSKVPARSLRALVACSLLVGFAAPAHAQAPRFRVTDLGTLGFNPSTTEDRRTLFGINNNGEVVFNRMIDSQFRAMLCLPHKAAYGLEPGIYDLNDDNYFDEFDLDPPNRARDINIDGLIVGQVYDLNLQVKDAVVWDLASDPRTMTYLGHLSASDWSGAFAINDADPPVIVGESDDFGWCPDLEDEECGWPTNAQDVLVSFHVTFEGDPPFSLTPLGMLEQDCDQSSSARDVADLGSGQ